MIDEIDERLDGLTVRHERDRTVDVGMLRVAARANGFAGTSTAYFNDSGLLEFAGRIASYPLREDDPLSISGGAGSVEHVGNTVAPVGKLGQVSVVVHLAEAWRDERRAARSSVQLEILTTYQRLRQFSTDLSRVIKDELPEARLGVETLA